MAEKDKLHFNIDVPQLIREISINEDMRFMTQPLRILQAKLVKLGNRAIEINDPELNIIMLEMKIYDVEHEDIPRWIEREKQKMDK